MSTDPWSAAVDPLAGAMNAPDPGADLPRQAALCLADVPVPFPDGIERVLCRLASRDDPAVWDALVDSLGRALRRAPQLERTERLCRWALSSKAPLRRLAAALLAGDVLSVGAATILGQLARDRDARVRRLAALAADARRRTNPVAFVGILERLAGDRDARVRSVARRLLRKERPTW